MLKKEENKLKRRLNSIFHNKIITNDEYKKALSIINQFEEVDSFFFNYNLGKILFLRNDLDNAKYYLEKALEFNNTNSSLYFILYKLDVRMGDFEEAFLDLFKYIQFCNCPCNVDLPLTLLEEILDLKYSKKDFYSKNYEISLTNYFGSFCIDNQQILNLYYEMINAFNKKDFIELKTKSYELQKLVNEINYPIEVDTLLIIVREFFKRIDEYNKNYIKDIIKNVENIDNNSLSSIIKLIDNDNYIDQKQLLLEIDKLINIDLEKAWMLLSFVDQDKMSREYNYLKGKISEKYKYYSYNKEKRKKCNGLIRLGTKALNENEFDLAYNYYLSGKCCTNHPIFDYYLGKVLYKQKKYSEAESYFLNYNKYHGSKYRQSLLYLGFIYRDYGDGKRIKKIVQKIEKIDNSLYPDKRINCSILKSSYGEGKIAGRDLLIDYSKLNIESYYDYSFTEKVAFIRKMFLEGRYDIAETLLKELIPSDENEKNMINRLNSDKKLLKTKSKYNN